MSREPETKKKSSASHTSERKASASKTAGKRTSGKKSSSKRAKKRKKAKMITFAVEAAVLLVLLLVLYVLNRTERFSKVIYNDEVVENSVTNIQSVQ